MLGTISVVGKLLKKQSPDILWHYLYDRLKLAAPDITSGTILPCSYFLKVQILDVACHRRTYGNLRNMLMTSISPSKEWESIYCLQGDFMFLSAVNS